MVSLVMAWGVLSSIPKIELIELYQLEREHLETCCKMSSIVPGTINNQ